MHHLCSCVPSCFAAPELQSWSVTIRQITYLECTLIEQDELRQDPLKVCPVCYDTHMGGSSSLQALVNKPSWNPSSMFASALANISACFHSTPVYGSLVKVDYTKLFPVCFRLLKQIVKPVPKNLNLKRDSLIQAPWLSGSAKVTSKVNLKKVSWFGSMLSPKIEPTVPVVLISDNADFRDPCWFQSVLISDSYDVETVLCLYHFNIICKSAAQEMNSGLKCEDDRKGFISSNDWKTVVWNITVAKRCSRAMLAPCA